MGHEIVIIVLLQKIEIYVMMRYNRLTTQCNKGNIRISDIIWILVISMNMKVGLNKLIQPKSS